MEFVFDFCIVEFGVDDRLSIAMLNSDTGETMVLSCAAIVALMLLEELGSALKSRGTSDNDGNTSA